MTLQAIDNRLYLDLLLLALKGNWEAYPAALTPEVETGASVVLMWLRVGEGIAWN